MTYEIYSTIDAGYTNVSLVMFKSFVEHNPDLRLKVCCINFSPKEYDRYCRQLSNLKNIEPIPVSFTDSLDHINTGSIDAWGIYQYHMPATMYKLKLFSEMTSDYILYLDVDLLIRKSLAPLLKEYTTDFVAHYYETYFTGIGINAGVLIARKGMPDLYTKSYDFFKKRKETKQPEEFYISHAGYSITELPAKFNYFRFVTTTEFVKDPYIIHFCSAAKPFNCKNVKNKELKLGLYYTALNCCFVYFDEWYTVFDSIADILDQEFVVQVNQAREFYKPFIEISKRCSTKLERFAKWK